MPLASSSVTAGWRRVRTKRGLGPSSAARAAGRMWSAAAGPRPTAITRPATPLSAPGATGRRTPERRAQTLGAELRVARIDGDVTLADGLIDERLVGRGVRERQGDAVGEVVDQPRVGAGGEIGRPQLLLLECLVEGLLGRLPIDRADLDMASGATVAQQLDRDADAERAGGGPGGGRP